MAHRDLGQFHLSVGDYTGALKHFTKIRESCTTSQHVVDMCISILEVGIPPFDPSLHVGNEARSSFSYYKATTLTSRPTSSKQTLRSMLHQMPRQRLQSPLFRELRQPKKARKGSDGKRNLILRALLLSLGKETTTRRRIFS